MLRSTGGWRELHSAKEAGIFLKSDERILGDSDFVESALSTAENDLEKKSSYHLNHVDLEKLVLVVAKVLNLEPKEVCIAGKQPQHVRARSLLCFWAVCSRPEGQVFILALLASDAEQNQETRPAAFNG